MITNIDKDPMMDRNAFSRRSRDRFQDNSFKLRRKNGENLLKVGRIENARFTFLAIRSIELQYICIHFYTNIDNH